jgi:ABC-type nitrate/sulfonate/bicarbonate transport system substrate-binding protein
MANRTLSGLLALLLVSGCSVHNSLRVASVPKDWFNAPLILAIDGWPGQPKPADVSSFSLTSGLASETAVAEGNADVGLASPVVLLQDSSAANSIRLLGCYMRSDSVLGIASRTDTVEPPIGYVKGTISEVYLALYMDKVHKGADYRAGRIAKVNMLPLNAAQALSGPSANGAVDSVVIWEPHLHQAAAQVNGKVLLDPGVYTVNVCLLANRQSFESSKRARIEAFAAVVAKASNYIAAQPNDARSRVEAETGLPAGSLSDAWPRVDFRYVSDPNSLSAILRTENQAVEQAGMQRGTPDISAFLR